MQDSIKLTREQVFFLISASVFGNLIYTSTWINDETDRAAWVATFIGIMLVIPFAVWIMFLGKKRPGETIFEILEKGMGKIPCAAISAIYIAINIIVAIAVLNMFTQMLKSLFYPFTPVWAIMLFIMLIAVMLASGNFKAFARTVELLIILGVFNYFITFVFAFPKYVHLSFVYPIFDTSLLGFIKGSIFMTGAAAECLLLLMIIVSFIPHPGKHHLWVVAGVTFSAVVETSAIILLFVTMSLELTKRMPFGGVNAAKIIEIGNFLRGLELFMYGTYQFAAIMKTGLCLFCAWTAAKKLFNNWRPSAQMVLIALLIYLPSVWLNSYIKAYQLAVLLGSYVLLPFSVFVLLLATAVVILQKENDGRFLK